MTVEDSYALITFRLETQVSKEMFVFKEEEECKSRPGIELISPFYYQLVTKKIQDFFPCQAYDKSFGLEKKCTNYWWKIVMVMAREETQDLYF